MLYVLREYKRDNVIVTEFTRNGIEVSHVVEMQSEPEVTVVETELAPPSIGEQILFETKYQTMILEMGVI